MKRQLIILESEDGLVLKTGGILLDHRAESLQLLTTALFALCNLPPSEEDIKEGKLIYNRPPVKEKKK